MGGRYFIARHLMNECEGERRGGVRVVWRGACSWVWLQWRVRWLWNACGAVMRSGVCASVRWRVWRGCVLCACSVLARERAARWDGQRPLLVTLCNVGCRIACHGHMIGMSCNELRLPLICN